MVFVLSAIAPEAMPRVLRRVARTLRPGAQLLFRWARRCICVRVYAHATDSRQPPKCVSCKICTSSPKLQQSLPCAAVGMLVVPLLQGLCGG